MIDRRAFASLLLVGLVPECASAQARYPDKPINVIVMFPPGGGTDIMARALGNVIEKHLGQPFTVINKAGGAGLIAGDFLVKAPPDGYTVGALVATGADPELFKHFRKPSYRLEDMVPVARVWVDPYGIVVKADAPWKTLKEFVAHVKANPSKLSWGHQGLGHSYHLRGSALIKAQGLDMNDVPFKGTAEEILAVLGNKIDCAFVSTAGSRSFLEAGQLRMLGLQHPQRLPYLPDVPTFAEQGFDTSPAFPLHYTGFLVPKGTPPDRVEILNKAVKAALADPQFLEAMKKGGSEVLYGTADEFLADVANMRKVYGQVLKDLGFE